MSDLLSESNSTLHSGADIFRLPGSPRNAEPDFPAVRAVQQHWEILRAGRVCPTRAEIDPKPLAHCLDVMFVAELVAPTVARLRLCGQQLGELLGMEPRGMPLSVFFQAEARVELTLEDGGQLRGTVAVRPTVQTFRDMDGQEGTNSLLRLDDLDDPAHQHVVWLDTVAKVEPIGSF